jgi:hypothetical protein
MKEINEEKEELQFIKTDGPENGHRGVDNLEIDNKKTITGNKVEEVRKEKGPLALMQYNNLRVKKRIAAELARLGLSKKAIGRILNINAEKN